MNVHSQLTDRKREIVRSGAVGASGGTAIVLLANNLPDGNIWKQWLVLAAPSISLLLAAVWAWLQVEVATLAREFKFRRLLASATKHMRTRLQAATLTDAQRRQVEKYIAELELMSVTREYTKVKELDQHATACTAYTKETGGIATGDNIAVQSAAYRV